MALDAVSLLWAEDLRQGSIELGFFIFPFAALVAVVARSPFPEWMPRVLGTILVGAELVFAVIGLWQAATHRVFFAHDLVVANAYTTFFRVTSLFKDPSLYGRYLVFGMVVVLVALWTRRLNVVDRGGADRRSCSRASTFSYSQSSMVTLFVLTVAIVLVAGDRQARRAVVVACVVFSLLAATALRGLGAAPLGAALHERPVAADRHHAAGDPTPPVRRRRRREPAAREPEFTAKQR